MASKESYGVYGIYYDDELVYIGMTMRNFRRRWENHRDNIINQTGGMDLYTHFTPEDIINRRICFKILIDIADIEANEKIEERDVESMELALIKYLKPKYNISGISKPYYYQYNYINKKKEK